MEHDRIAETREGARRFGLTVIERKKGILMKKALLTLVLTGLFAMTFAVTTSAQGMAAPKAYLGVKGGLAMADLYGDDADFLEIDMKAGFTGGAMAHFHFNQMWSIQPELLYVMKGGKSEDISGDIEFDDGQTITNFEGDLTWKLNYLEIPVLARLGIPNESKIDPFFYAGPAVSLLLSADASFEGTADGSAVDEEVDIKDILKSVDFGLIFGGGVGIEAGRGEVILDARYNLGLSSIDDSPDDADIKNGVISVFVGYQFALGM